MRADFLKIKTILAVLALISVIMVSGCGTYLTTTAVPEANDLGEKADVTIASEKQVKRDDKNGFLKLVFLDEDVKNFGKAYNEGTLETLTLFGQEGIDSDDSLPEGVSYDSSENTLILTDFQGDQTVLYTSDMGTDLRLVLHGESRLKEISVVNGGLSISGDGKLVIRDDLEGAIPIRIDGENHYGRLIIEPGVCLDLGGYGIYLIRVMSRVRKNFCYLAPLKMSDGKKRDTQYVSTASGSYTPFVCTVGENLVNPPDKEWDYVIIK